MSESELLLFQCSWCRKLIKLVNDLLDHQEEATHCFTEFEEALNSLPLSSSSSPLQQMLVSGALPPGPEARSSPPLERILCVASLQHQLADWPLCENCAKRVLDEVERKLLEVEADEAAYRSLVSVLEEERRGEQLGAVGEEATRLEMEKLRSEVEELEKEEARLIGEVSWLEYEVAQVESAPSIHSPDLEEVEALEIQANLEFTELLAQVQSEEEASGCVQAQTRYAKAQLQKLRKINVFNDAFHIWSQGSFGWMHPLASSVHLPSFRTINGFRLGTLPESPVSWSEIASAWGQAALLLDAVVRYKLLGGRLSMYPIRRCRIRLSSYRLLPRGSYSVVINKSDQSVLELYIQEGGLSRFFSGRRFDQAMVGFVAIFSEVLASLTRRGLHLRIPFKIEGDKVGGFSIRLQFNQEEKWTKALKFLLTDLKWLLASLKDDPLLANKE